MTYAVVESGGKQFFAREGETIEVDRLPLEEGQKVTFDQVLLVAQEDKILVGRPTVAGAKVEGKVVAQVKGPKIVVFKYKPKERYRRKQGHRQRYTRVLIERIQVAKGKASAKAEAGEEAEEAKPKRTRSRSKAAAKKDA